MFKSHLLAELLERCTFPPSRTPVVCAVSGGPDSMALLALAVAAGCEVTAVHVDHGLRPDSAREADVVRAAAERFGAAFEARVVRVEWGPNVEARARAARYEVLPSDALVGHTADDQAETIVMNLLRGSGLDGLAGMRDGSRPIIRLRRAETHMLCAALGVDVVRDPMNEDLSLLRSRVRHKLLPSMSEAVDRDIVPIVARQADGLRAEVMFLDELASEIDPTNADDVASAPVVLARRAVRNWLRVHLDDEQHPPSSAAVERVLAVARGGVKACEVEGGVRVARTGGRLRLETASIGRRRSAATSNEQ
jgi:tRNA(Ile)-lysidine synthase